EAAAPAPRTIASYAETARPANAPPTHAVVGGARRRSVSQRGPSSRRRIPDRPAGGVLDIPRPRVRAAFRDRFRQRHVVEIRRELLAVTERPVEELEDLDRVLRLVLLCVHTAVVLACGRPL